MSDKTVSQLAEIVKIPLERLLEQLKEAGLSASTPDDFITEDEKMQLLAHLRKRHGKTDAEGGPSDPTGPSDQSPVVSQSTVRVVRLQFAYTQHILGAWDWDLRSIMNCMHW